MRGRFDELVAYITDMPCINCYKAMVAVNVKEIHCGASNYVDLARDELIKEFEVPIYTYKDSNDTWKRIEDILEDSLKNPRSSSMNVMPNY
jgi:deoxycytidylate deaminase